MVTDTKSRDHFLMPYQYVFVSKLLFYYYLFKGKIINGLYICLAVCNPYCENGGTCEKPNKCSCPKNYDGPSCQNLIVPKYCHGFPNTPMNTKKKCNSE